ncbi:hypothetical protein E6P09_09075 [Haloferax mediterranei ATCC 33500]|uniref:Actin-like ATPase involved in cell morphogenesis n=1 Tax=Haloferax mediterranei (strain ATCC 33500 / DSM 1411 / JCM 8866 / NBRC 14739 / NCIMB 2177 / R-4) TaxID=523841 RepID=I3R3W5_HALMT|nr:hypothetical protein [Haloferax mediterranei]AFK18925.1 hypothetical protein HFX_1212 [Haloferax mediterranei ATCC 33500]AHZ21712.1 hypothetical protein BM92_03135 [Haloferax mediterranei ATCC 33500]EMA03216.1 hypothetical protein C439_04440 [Haloferax mediterranei ATCC 33500]MDX5989018.1 hypothetical protein [Haloferax mediterranei ATCC 33500]QCQ75411.1 hypothetical protein E6P09_09075 [Haloferax mediterranei ATCC 33500]
MTNKPAHSNAVDTARMPTPVGVKLGSTRTALVYDDDAGNQETVRTLSCLATYEDTLTKDERVLYGEEAARQYPERTEYMLRSGLPKDAESAELTDQFFGELCDGYALPEESAVVYAIPTVGDDVGLANLNTVIEESAIGKTLVRGFPESLCASIPAIGDNLEAIEEIFVAINLGATTLEACAYRHGEQLSPFVSEAATGDQVDQRVADVIKEETDGRVAIDYATAREYKEGYADFNEFEAFTDVIQHPDEGSHEFTVDRSIMGPVDRYLDDVVDELTTDFFSRLANAHMKTYQLSQTRPIVVTGGMTCIPGLVDELETRLSEELDREVDLTVPDNPDLAAAEGAYRIAERLLDRY